MAARGKGLRRKTTLLSPRKWECVMLKWSNFELHDDTELNKIEGRITISAKRCGLRCMRERNAAQ
jgi:hypothetical protein